MQTILTCSAERRRYLAYLNLEELKQGMIVQVIKVVYHAEHSPKLNWENDLNNAPWAIISGGLLVWLVEDWEPDNLDSIHSGYFVDLQAGERLTINKTKKELANESAVR